MMIPNHCFPADNDIFTFLILQGIGFQFLARMLRSKDSPDGCPKLMFQSVALSVLSCFANESEIMTHPSVLVISSLEYFVLLLLLVILESDCGFI